MNDKCPNLDDIRAAACRIAPYVHRTPLLTSRYLAETCGAAEVLLKCENLQKTGSFKPRGAINRIATMEPEELERGVITISAGNHAQGVAYAAARLNVPSVVVMPETAPAAKVAAARSYGAECVLHGDVHAAFVKLKELQEARGLALVHPFDDPMIVAGHGTVGTELTEQAEHVDVVVVGIGGGGLIGGVSTAVKELFPDALVYGVEPEGAATMSAALEAGEVVRLDHLDTIADGLAPPFVGNLNLQIATRTIDRVLRVTDKQIKRAMTVLLERAKLLAEPAGAAATAAVLENLVPIQSGQRVAIIVSGGNVDLGGLPQLLQLS